MTATRVTLVVDTLPPSPNRTRRQTHWSHRAKVDQLWRQSAWWAKPDGLTAPRWDKVRLSIVFYLPSRRRYDPGNLLASEGLKAFIDGIVDLGIMVDDSVEVIKEYGPFTFVYRKGKPGMEVTVEPVE